jgi:hypothetical protein
LFNLDLWSWLFFCNVDLLLRNNITAAAESTKCPSEKDPVDRPKDNRRTVDRTGQKLRQKGFCQVLTIIDYFCQKREKQVLGGLWMHPFVRPSVRPVICNPSEWMVGRERVAGGTRDRIWGHSQLLSMTAINPVPRSYTIWLQLRLVVWLSSVCWTARACTIISTDASREINQFGNNLFGLKREWHHIFKINIVSEIW